MSDIIKLLEKKREEAKLGGGKRRINSQHAKGSEVCGRWSGYR